ncbi:hypothetical protein JDY09_08075 [Thermoleophilum album]|uniref:hypothetical protein n=1 Tax=Thermoleophilum album TaxID=29539 RepID=UPI00237CF447|nr:hypothetical protein [Thermoleophilum album]MCL6440623.1 hypothetical protein [Thermoleophilum sp.]WDT93338.1 hypothetical protein JDY09_08075 [Thermoleophilum album]
MVLPAAVLFARASRVVPLAKLPEQSGGFAVDPSFFVATFAVGFAIAVAGHLFQLRALVAAGVALVLLATVFLPLALHLVR